MFARSIFASYYKLLTGAGLALLALALVGCNEIAAQTGGFRIQFGGYPHHVRSQEGANRNGAAQ